MQFLKRLRPWLCVISFPLNGCLVSTHTLRRVQMPSHVITASAEQLIGSINHRCEAIMSLAAIVDFQLVEGGPRRGKQTTTTSFGGTILQRNPGSLRVTVQLPVVGTKALDMATEGQAFTLWIPVRNEAFEGPNTVTTQSQNALENLRPSVFSDSLLLSCVAPDDLVTLTSETKTVLDPKAKHLVAQPDYDLMVLRKKENSQELLVTERVVHFNRTTMIPYQEDVMTRMARFRLRPHTGPWSRSARSVFRRRLRLSALWMKFKSSSRLRSSR